MEIVINGCYGGFGLSHKGIMRYAELKGITLYASKENNYLTHYYTVPEEEYEKARIEDKKNGNYRNSNALYFSDGNIPRTDPILAQVVRELGKNADGDCAELKIAEIPDGVDYEIEEYDGIEWVAEAHRTWH